MAKNLIKKQKRDPKYSICMSNYNMADTLHESLSSILNQIDPIDFEVVLVDDGSSDDSVKIINRIQQNHKNLRLFKLKRDRNRKLGHTRNISIQKSKGKYVLLHLDCDDVFGPHIEDFVEVFHQIEKSFGHEILLSGRQINMGARDFLLEHGPYRNLFQAEDRDLWLRMSEINRVVFLKHHKFFERLPKTRKKNLTRIFINSWDQVVYNSRLQMSFYQFFIAEIQRWKNFSIPLIILRILYIVPALVCSKISQPITYKNEGQTFKELVKYRELMSGSFSEILKRNNMTPNFDKLTPNGKKLFDI